MTFGIVLLSLRSCFLSVLSFVLWSMFFGFEVLCFFIFFMMDASDFSCSGLVWNMMGLALPYPCLPVSEVWLNMS